MRKNRLWYALAALTLVWTLIVPSMAASPASESVENSVPYPPRHFLYIVDCSDSMVGHGDALDMGRQMLLELLPAESTTVVAFRSEALTLKGPEIETFASELKPKEGEATSVLAGLREADKQLEALWADNPDQEVTAVLFSDLLSTVSADTGGRLEYADPAVIEAERGELGEIAERWSGYVFADKLRFYTLNWPSDEESDGYHMRFPVPPPSAESAPNLSTELSLNADILKTCVEVYAGMLTGSSGTEWEEVPVHPGEDGTLKVPLGERYRGFLYLNEIPDHAKGPLEEELSLDWKLGDDHGVSAGEEEKDVCAIVVPTGGGKEGVCTIEGVSADVEVMSFQIPQPRLEVSFSSDTPSVFDTVTIKLGVTDGKNYLGYDESNSYCFLEVTAPGESIPEMPTALYDPGTCSYEFTYTPKTLGTHEFRLTYVVLGAEPDVRELVYEKETKCEPPVPSPQQRRAYNAMARKLLELKKGGVVSFSLSDYFTSRNMRLEFVVDAPEDSGIAVWSPSADETGAVTVQGRRGGSTTLRYTINCYLEGEDVPSGSKSYELQISVQKTPEPPLYFVMAAVIAAAVVCLAVIVIRRGRKHTD